MDIDRFIKSERSQRSACCDARIQIVYKNVTNVRSAAVYVCLSCDRLNVVDSRDEEEIIQEPDLDSRYGERMNGDKK